MKILESTIVQLKGHSNEDIRVYYSSTQRTFSSMKIFESTIVQLKGHSDEDIRVYYSSTQRRFK